MGRKIRFELHELQKAESGRKKVFFSDPVKKSTPDIKPVDTPRSTVGH